MKKIVCLALALSLCLITMTLAEPVELVALTVKSVPSKTTSDLMQFEVTVENMPEDADINFFLMPVHELTVGQDLVEYQERIDICQIEIQKLMDSESIEDYFGEVTDAEGNPVILKELLGLTEGDPLNVFEFCPIIARGYQKEYGKVTATMLFSTPYEKDEKVLVLIGIVTVHEDDMQTDMQIDLQDVDLQDMDLQTVEWQVFEGVGLDVPEGQEEITGRIQVELTPEILEAIQTGTALLAIVSGAANDVVDDVVVNDVVSE